MNLATIQASQRRCARERQESQNRHEQAKWDFEQSQKSDPAGRSNAQIRAALLAYQLPPEDQAVLDEAEAWDRREAKAAPIRARNKAKREAKAKRDRVRARAKREAKARAEWLNWAPTTGRFAGISLVGRKGRK